jgi:hypothetical protein
MPCLSGLVVWLWAIGTIATVALIVLMLVSGYIRRWPSVFCYLSLITILSVFCVLAKGFRSHVAYFYGYWIIQFLIDIARVWIIVQIALSVAGVTPWLRRVLSRGVLAFTVAALTVCAYISFRDSMQGWDWIVYIVQHLEIAVQLSLCLTLTLLVCGAKGVGIQWSGVRLITSGLLLEVLSSDLSPYLYRHFQTVSVTAIVSVSYLVTIGLWGLSVIRWTKSFEKFTVRRTRLNGTTFAL